MPLGTFINEIFGDILGLNFEISPQISSREDLVTLRAQEVSKDQVFNLARSVLRDYGIGVQKEQGEICDIRLRGAPPQQYPAPSIIPAAIGNDQRSKASAQ